MQQRLSTSALVESKVTVVLGAQWGDEGKGKVVDMLAMEADIVCRCQVKFILTISSAQFHYYSQIFRNSLCSNFKFVLPFCHYLTNFVVKKFFFTIIKIHVDILQSIACF